MELGQIVYKRKGLCVEKYRVTKIEMGRADLINLRNNVMRTLDITTIKTSFSNSRIIIVREILFELDILRDKVIDELGEYELQVLQGHRSPENPKVK